MKKGKLAIVSMLLLVTVLSLAGCSKKQKCSICEEVKSGKTIEVLGQKVFVCDDCRAEMEGLFN